MIDPNKDIIQKAKNRLRYSVLKVNIITHIILILSAIVFTYIFIQILVLNIENFDIEDIGRENQGIILIPFFVFWGLFYLLARRISKISNPSWKFWVLKNVHHLQDFTKIRKLAVKNKYILAYEVWLDKDYIIRKSEKSQQQKLLDKLEIFEYAFEEDLKDNLPMKLIYKVNLYRSNFQVFYISFLFGVLPLYGLLTLEETESNNSWFYGSLIFSSISFTLLIAILIRWIPSLFFKTTHLVVDIKGVKLKKFKQMQLISWKYISRIEYKSEYIGEDIVYFIYFHFYNNQECKFEKEEHKIATTPLRPRGDIIFREVKAMHQKYLDKQEKKANFKT